MIEIGSGQIKTVTFSLCLFLEIPSGYSMRLCAAMYVWLCVWLCVCIFVTSQRVWFGVVHSFFLVQGQVLVQRQRCGWSEGTV